MNCQSLGDAIVEVARDLPVGPGTAAAVETHVAHCASCAARLARERQLSAGLRALAAATIETAPSALEERLQHAFAERHATSAMPSRRMHGWWPRAAAAAIVAGAGLAWWSVTVGPARNADPAGVPQAGKPSSPAIAEGFVPLPVSVGLPDFESGEIVRIEIPVASLPSYGIEIAPDARRTPVQADLLVGQDGQARAIRLVRSTPVDRTGTP